MLSRGQRDNLWLCPSTPGGSSSCGTSPSSDRSAGPPRLSGISQPALSKNIAVLERSVGAPVVERTRKGIDAHRESASSCCVIRTGSISCWRAHREEVSERKKGLSGSLAIGVSPVATASLVPRALTGAPGRDAECLDHDL